MMSTLKSLGLFHSRAMTGLAITIVTTCVTLPVLADDTKAWALEKTLVPFTASYTVGNNSIVAGRADIELSKMGPENDWHYSLSTKPSGLFRLTGKGRVQESAAFQIVDENTAFIIKPRSYKFRQDREQKRAIDATFIWSQKQLYFKRGKDNDALDINANTLDRMTMTVAMMSNLTPDFDTFTMTIFDGGKLKKLELVNEGIEKIKTVLGEVETVRVRTTNMAGSKRETITWFAPSLNNVPVRIEQLKNGDLVVRLSINLYEPAPQP